MAGVAGVEPAYQGVKVPCLAAWLHPNAADPAAGKKGGRWGSNPRFPEPQSGALATELHPPSNNRSGAPEGIRTPDPRLRRPLLYPTELQAHTRTCRSS